MKLSRLFVLIIPFRKVKQPWWNVLDWTMFRLRQSYRCLWDVWLVWNVKRSRQKWMNCMQKLQNTMQFWQMNRRFAQSSRKNFWRSKRNLTIQEEPSWLPLRVKWISKIWFRKNPVWLPSPALDISNVSLWMFTKPSDVVEEVSAAWPAATRTSAAISTPARLTIIWCSLPTKVRFTALRDMRFRKVPALPEEPMWSISCRWSRMKRLPASSKHLILQPKINTMSWLPATVSSNVPNIMPISMSARAAWLRLTWMKATSLHGLRLQTAAMTWFWQPETVWVSALTKRMHVRWEELPAV